MICEIFLNCNHGHEDLFEKVEESLEKLNDMKKLVERLDFGVKRD